MCLIFVGKARRRKFLNGENFSSYGMLYDYISEKKFRVFSVHENIFIMKIKQIYGS